MEAATFASAASSQLSAVKCFSTSALSSSYSTSHSLQFLKCKPVGETLKFKQFRTFSIRSSASGERDNVVTLLDYGAGNVRSVRNAIRFLGFDIKDVQTPEDIMSARCLIFPGVGAFAAAMDVLNRRGMAEALCRYIEQDRPFLGICLGLQLLFESSDENGPAC